ncbi:type I-E CRISPR-associated protein Cse2/CasB [Arthrobacter sp. Y-9]|uniref:type I-E CRISPR-associated protein Cse2/CasB n=1 Tax=Arthrobacter sp. Y-9 TaxID=3039385 RepID=UPI00241C37C1|nr:type I-E CRISPR-associated protein Cse2/CasB [Arthrobacter sp. Y-9]WFR83731.1 type I-E CRISPR-associated protein Cse2/CasB [Arthrobacter sp. Y-9]
MTERPGLAQNIDARIRKIQRIYLEGHRPLVAGTLARLRRAVATEPGSDPWVWHEAVEGLPTELAGQGDAASPGERAAYAAMTLYAVHQQSKSMPMHQTGPSLGRAVRRLGTPEGAEGASAAVKRRFDALMTSTTFNELQHHSRGLIQQLRAADIALDYGRFAEDLRLLQNPVAANSVRLRWGRDYAFGGTRDTPDPQNSDSREGTAS